MIKTGFYAFLTVYLITGSGLEVVYAHGRAHNPTRHHYIMRHGIPEGYRDRLNPLRRTADNLSVGENLYRENCAVCHGPAGKGDGLNAAVLDPAPPGLADMYAAPMSGMDYAGPDGHLMHGVMHHHPGMTHAEAMGGLNLDAYIFWSISEGGQPMGSSMPAFKNALSERARWQILLFIANGFSADGGQ